MPTAPQVQPQNTMERNIDAITSLFEATVQATEEAILNALVSAKTMTGMNGNTVPELPHEAVQELLRAHHRLESD